MANTSTGYWKLLNALGKFAGICFILGGVAVLVFGAAQRDWLIGIPGFVVTVLGVLLTLARAYRPHAKD